MHDTFRVRGTAMRYGGPEHLVIVEEAKTKRPVMLQAFGGMMDYLWDVGSTDAEEKYMDVDFIYDSNCTLVAILVPSTEKMLPAKAIIQNSSDLSVCVYGTDETINTKKPKPMGYDQWEMAWMFAMESEEFNLRA